MVKEIGEIILPEDGRVKHEEEGVAPYALSPGEDGYNA